MFNNELFLLRFGKYMKQLLSIKEKALKIVKSVRGSTAAGINISLLPRDCSCGEFACSAVWGRDLFPDICEEFADGAVWGRGLFSLVFVGFPVALYRKSPFPWHLWGICRWCYTGRGFFSWCLLDFR